MKNLEGKPEPKLDIPNQSVSEESIENREKKLVVKQSIERAFSLLDEKRSTILKMRLGMKPYKKRYTLEEVANVFKIIRETTRAHQNIALEKVISCLSKDLTDAGYDVNFDIFRNYDGKINDKIDNMIVLIENTCPELLSD